MEIRKPYIKVSKSGKKTVVLEPREKKKSLVKDIKKTVKNAK